MIYRIFFFCNIKQLLEAESKLIYIVHLKSFLFKLDNVLLFKMYVYIVGSQIITRDVKPEFFCDFCHIS